jgi:hypothetical protein
VYIKQSTAVVLSFGPFVAPGDGVTLVTSLVSALDNGSTGIFLSKNGGALTIRHASVTATTYDAYGNYRVTLDATDTNTLGSLRVQFAAAASCLPVWVDLTVLPANIYDSLVGGSDLLDVSVTQWLGTAVATPGVAGIPSVDAVRVGGTVQTGRDLGASVLLSSGTGTGQLDFTSGVVKANLAQILGTALTETAGQIAAAFKQFFDVGTPTGTMKAITNVVTATNLTNAPSSGDFTSVMKTSLNAATPAVTVSDKTGFRLSSTGVNDILRTAMTEGYAADGSPPTLEQAVFMLIAKGFEVSIVGTTMTVKKLDGSTPAMTFTLNSAATPTSITRAT